MTLDFGFQASVLDVIVLHEKNIDAVMKLNEGISGILSLSKKRNGRQDRVIPRGTVSSPFEHHFPSVTITIIIFMHSRLTNGVSTSMTPVQSKIF